ncbi:response regulator [bacterium]|nr:response regulator [FCB group bacterium]MBL7191437.1 response regulator [bacterium]
MKSENVNTERLIKVLIVDDDPGSISFMKSALEDKYEIYSLTSGNGISDIISEKGIDVLLLDIVLPHNDSLQLTKTLKKGNSDLGVILVTAYSSEERAIEALKSGADDYLRKPMSPSDLIFAVERNCRRRMERQKLEEERRLMKLRNSVKQVQRSIRDPINVIFGYLELCKKKYNYCDNPELEKLCEAIKRNAMTILNVVNGLLEDEEKKEEKRDHER